MIPKFIKIEDETDIYRLAPSMYNKYTTDFYFNQLTSNSEVIAANDDYYNTIMSNSSKLEIKKITNISGISHN